jgi:signal transduction histidine kinase
MLIVESKPQQHIAAGRQQSFEIAREILRGCSDLAECKSEDIERVVRRAVGEIEHAEMADWFFLAESGELTNVFRSTPNPISLCSAFHHGLSGLPWCLSQLKEGKAVLIDDVNELPEFAEIDRQSLKDAAVHSVALLPSNSTSTGRTVLILMSISSETNWSDEINEQCALLETMFSIASQRMHVREPRTVVKYEEKELSRRRTEVELLASQLIQSQENERRRLSRELHDDIGQGLSLAASEAALLASQYSNTGSISAGRLDALHHDLDDLCSDIHHLSHDLHCYKLQHLGLKSALEDLCRRLSQPGFRVELYGNDLDEPVSKDVSLCLYRVAQESLSNALKHAHTPVAAVAITKLQDRFYMTIQDCGIGFDSSRSLPGLGLISMSERLKLVNGKFRIHSIPGRGTEIWVEVPDERGAVHQFQYPEWAYQSFAF